MELEQIEARLAGFAPELKESDPANTAAVALLLREGKQGSEIFFIERARREGDPWSGHMAFPGGRMEQGDDHSRGTAERETLEEVGLTLERSRYLGALDDLQGSSRFQQSRLVVSAHVYHAIEPGPVVLDEREVQAALWLPLADLVDPLRHVEYALARQQSFKFPGIQVGEPSSQIVWGLTYRFLEIFMRAIDAPLPDRYDPATHVTDG
jgi:8-oxo-dGTP pyrophosphatase MutT (NUDIX family)